MTSTTPAYVVRVLSAALFAERRHGSSLSLSLLVYFIGKTTASPDDKCPTKNAERNSATGVCQCQRGYEPTDQNRQCGSFSSNHTNTLSRRCSILEIRLSNQVFQPTCSTDRSNDQICIDAYGKRAVLCASGECRCSGEQSFPNVESNRCCTYLDDGTTLSLPARCHCLFEVAPVNQGLSAPIEDCPPGSYLKGSQCVCNDGYRPATDARQCGRNGCVVTTNEINLSLVSS